MTVKEGDNSAGGAPTAVIADSRQEMKQVFIATFAVWSGAASYVLMMLLTMPISIHMIVNMGQGCDIEKGEACFAPTADSQNELTVVLSALRLCTFVMGCFLGTLSDRIGRKPLMFMALSGYALTGILYLIGWSTKSFGLFLLGGMILGTFSPITPTGIAYVSDISSQDRMAGNLGILQGIGYFMGLQFGALGALAITTSTTTRTPTIETPLKVLYDNMFWASYGSGFALALFFAILVFFFLPESLPASMRKVYPLREFLFRANPLQTVFMFTRSKYMFCLWLSAFIGYVSIGANEAVTSGWWMRRYLATDLGSLIKFLVFFWLLSGVGSIIMTKIYVRFLGVKKACHLSMILTILLGVLLPMARTVNESYLSAILSFFASAAIPTLMSLLLNQVEPAERGALAGALRSSEALGKFIGIAIFGAMFASYIAPFTPDRSCIPSTYSPLDKTNTCECGVNTCPTFFNSSAILYMPKTCSLGELSPAFYGSYSRDVPFVSADKESRPVYPQLLLDKQMFKRDDTCIGAGGFNKGIGYTTKLSRAWCAAPSAVGPSLNAIYGCPGYDINNVYVLSCLSNTTLYAYGMACYPAGAKAVLGSYAASVNETVPNTTSPTGPNTAACLSGASSCNMTIFRGFVMKYAATVNVSKTLLLTSRVTNASHEGDAFCPEEGTADFNLCWKGPIGSFLGIVPFIYLACLGIVSYFFFLIAELFFAGAVKQMKPDASAVTPDTKSADK